MRRLVATLLFAFALPAFASHDGVRVFERADRIQTEAYLIPGDEWDWRPGALPHNWYADSPPFSQVWYRLRFSLDHAPYVGHSLYLARLPVTDLTVYVNERQIWRLTERNARGSALTAVLITVPGYMLREGDNVIHLQVEGRPPVSPS